MRIQLIITALLFSLNCLAVDDKTMKELFKNYDLVMDQKKTELIDEVFTKKFIKESGGKEDLIQKIKELTPPPPSQPQSKMTWKKGQTGDIYLAKVKEVSTNKKKESHEAEFIVLIEDGKPKIDGTMSDAD